MKSSIGIKFGAALFAATLTPILFFGYHDFTTERERLAQEKLRELYVNAVTRATSLERVFVNAHADLNYLRTAMPIRFLMDVPRDRPEGSLYWRSLVEREFHHFLALKRDYAEVGLIDLEGDEILILRRNGESLDSLDPGRLRNRATAPHVTAAISLPRYGIAALPMRDARDPVRSLGEVTLLRYTTRVYDRQGSVRFYVYVDVNGAHADYALRHTTYEHRRPAALLTAEGRYLYRPDEEGDEAAREGGSLPLSIRDQFPDAVASQILSGRPGVIADNEAALYAYAPIHPQVGEGRLFYVIFDHFDRARFEPALAPLRKRYLTGGGVALGVTALLAVVVAGALTRHLRKLRHGVEKFAARKLDHRIAIRSGDEIEELAIAYNAMAASLESHHESLERKVAQRTDEVRRVESRLAHAEKLAAIGFLAAGVAHEVNNPIAIIMTRLDLIRKELGQAASAVALKDLEVVERHATRIGEIAGGLLGFARTGGREIGRNGVNRITNRVCQLIAHPIEKKGIAFTTAFADDELWADVSESALEQALYNLLYNAYQAARPGDEIMVATRSEGDEVVIAVRDTGPGVPEEIIGKIFDPFFTTKEPGEGTGLGLSLSYGLIREGGGDLLVESEPGKGALFTIRLPGAWRKTPSGQDAKVTVDA